MAKRRKGMKAVEPARDAKGRILPGHTLNPGGIPKKAAEVRRLALNHAERAVERAAELMESEDSDAAAYGIRFILERAAGRPALPSELPDDTAIPAPSDTSPKALVDSASSMLAMLMARQKAKMEGGEAVAEAVIVAVAEQVKALSALAREEREMAKQGTAATLSDAELKATVLASMSEDDLAEALAKKRGA